ncbi:hypothetical protein AC1031_019795 [Aphanomyces cochlioides]|nr:hypothetical protein AC1031_019795 [Aphanomyces cochlioides]
MKSSKSATSISLRGSTNHSSPSSAKESRSRRAVSTTERTAYVSEGRGKSTSTPPIKAKVSAKQFQQYIRWLNCLRVWPEEMTFDGFHEQMRNGVLLAHVVHAIVPSFSLKSIQMKAKTVRAAHQNLEAILCCLSRFPISIRHGLTREALWSGNRSALALFIQEIFSKVALKRIPIATLRTWANGILQLYDQAYLSTWDIDCADDGLWHGFRSGIRFWCLLHYYGYDNSPQRDRLFNSTRVYANPIEQDEYLANAYVVCSIWRHFDIPSVWDTTSLMSTKNHGFILTQLQLLYDRWQTLCCLQGPIFAVDFKTRRHH